MDHKSLLKSLEDITDVKNIKCINCISENDLFYIRKDDDKIFNYVNTKVKQIKNVKFDHPIVEFKIYKNEIYILCSGLLYRYELDEGELCYVTLYHLHCKRLFAITEHTIYADDNCQLLSYDKKYSKRQYNIIKLKDDIGYVTIWKLTSDTKYVYVHCNKLDTGKGTISIVLKLDIDTEEFIN